MEYKKFRSTGSPIFIASLTGHVASIGSELVDVPDALWGQAYAAGAISEDMQVDSMAKYLADKKQEELIKKEEERVEVKKVLKEILNNPQGFVNANNRPQIRKVIGKLGKPVKKDFIDSLWDELLEETSKEE